MSHRLSCEASTLIVNLPAPVRVVPFEDLHGKADVENPVPVRAGCFSRARRHLRVRGCERRQALYEYQGGSEGLQAVEYFGSQYRACAGAERGQGGGKGAATPTPPSFPKVDANTQQQRDLDRRRILEQELASEDRLLAQARKELAEQESQRLGNERNYQRVLERLDPFKKRVKLHEDNVASLKRELAAIKSRP